jgi:competence protein ComEA
VPGGTASPAATGEVVVHVIGEVRRPGIVTLPAGSRVSDAVEAAGGLRRGGSSGGLNLARALVDGEQVVVGPDAPAEPARAAGPASPGSPLDLNSATLEQLDGLPGVGPVLAGRILDWRTAHGRFAAVDQLREVSGIGARTFEQLAPLVRV